MTIAQTITTLRQLFTTIRDERRTHANTATRVGSAFLALLDYLDSAPFLRKDCEDTDGFLLRLLKGAVIGDNAEISLMPDGSVSCGSIRVNGAAVFDELVFNRQNVLEGDTYFTDRAIIESVSHTDLNQYLLTFRREYDDDRITFHANDILLGRVNNLDRAKTFRSFWLRVEQVDSEANTALCTLYADADCPGGYNSAPVAAARVIRWGNAVDEARQSVWFVSSNDGRWLFLQGVNKPKLDDNEHGSNYAGFIGLPPDIEATRDLISRGIISKSQPYLFFRGIMAQDFIKVDYKGNPEYTPRDCGQWNASRRYIHGYDADARGYYADRVWWGGCYWQCAVSESAGSEPRFNNTDWVCIIGGGNMAVQIVSSAGNFFRADTDWTTDLVATVYNAEMQLQESEIGLAAITWLRQSADADGDAAWNMRHPTGSVGLTLHIDSRTDLPSAWTAGSSVGFMVIVTFPDGAAYSAQYTVIN